MDQIEWNAHVDNVLSIADANHKDSDFYASLKRNVRGEYEMGIGLDRLEKVLKSLKEGDQVLFSFKAFSKWIALFTDFFKKNENSLKYLIDSDYDLKSLNQVAGKIERLVRVVTIKVKVVALPVEIDEQTAKLLTLCLKRVWIVE